MQPLTKSADSSATTIVPKQTQIQLLPLILQSKLCRYRRVEEFAESAEATLICWTLYTKLIVEPPALSAKLLQALIAGLTEPTLSKRVRVCIGARE